MKRVTLLGLLTLTTQAACLPEYSEPVHYAEPPANAPHALVVVERRHETMPKPQWQDGVAVDGRPLEFGESVQKEVALRVAPGVRDLKAHSTFFHYEDRDYDGVEHHTKSEYSLCARHNSRGECEGGWVDYQVTERVRETRRERVTDVFCETNTRYQFEEGRKYRLIYRFEGRDRCFLRCADLTDGDSKACLVAPPAPKSRG